MLFFLKIFVSKSLICGKILIVLEFNASEKVYDTISFSRLSSRTFLRIYMYMACLPVKKGNVPFFSCYKLLLKISSGFNVTSSGSIYFASNFWIKSGYFSFVNSYGVLPPKISLGILLIFH